MSVRTPSLSCAATGFAYLSRFASRRPIWRVLYTFENVAGEQMLEQKFIGPEQEISSVEKVVYHESDFRHVSSVQPHLDEFCEAHIKILENGSYLINYTRKVGQLLKTRNEVISSAPLTLASMPLFIRDHASALVEGKMVQARYLVLKVMRSAQVRVGLKKLDQEHVEIIFTPVNFLLRTLFGSTSVRMKADLSCMIGYCGLLAPRDRKQNGRWAEYLGEIAFDYPFILAEREKQ